MKRRSIALLGLLWTSGPGWAQSAENVTADQNVKFSILKVEVAGESGYLASDPNWLQMTVRVDNVGKSIIKVIDLKEKLSDGTTVVTAQSLREIQRPPSILGQTAATTALGVAGTFAAMLIPFAGPLAGMAIVGKGAADADSAGDRLRKIRQVAIKASDAEYITPGTAVQGVVWSPAVKDPQGFQLLYSIKGEPAVLEIKNRYASPGK